MKFPTTIGFEFTGIPDDYRECRSRHKQCEINRIPSYIGYAVARALCRDGLVKKSFADAIQSHSYSDGHCIEVPSPLFRNLAGVKKFYLGLRKAFRELHIFPHHPETVCGGNHMHFQTEDMDLIRATLRHMATHPSIGWVFLQADDTESAEPLMRTKGNVQKQSLTELDTLNGCAFNAVHPKVVNRLFDIQKLRNERWGCFEEDVSLQDFRFFRPFLFLSTNAPMFIDDMRRMVLATKLDAVTYSMKNKTIEFRCLEAPKNWQELELQIRFFVTYYKWLSDNKNKIAPLSQVVDLKSYTKSKGTTEFLRVLDTLGLPHQPYMKFVKRNLQKRLPAKVQAT
jgi:hypothetical protein